MRGAHASATMDTHDLGHAIRNHLAIILGFTELLLQDAGHDDSRRADYQEIHKAATAALRLLSDQGTDHP